MTVNTNGPLSGQETPQFTTAELAARTQILIAEMDRQGTKIRRDEWSFDNETTVRINYAHRELRVHVSHKRATVGVVSVNLDSTDPHFPSLDELLQIPHASSGV